MGLSCAESPLRSRPVGRWDQDDMGGGFKSKTAPLGIVSSTSWHPANADVVPDTAQLLTLVPFARLSWRKNLKRDTYTLFASPSPPCCSLILLPLLPAAPCTSIPTEVVPISQSLC